MLVTLKQNWVHKSKIYYAGSTVDLKKIGLTKEEFDNTFLSAGKKTLPVKTSAEPQQAKPVDVEKKEASPVKTKRTRRTKAQIENAL